MALAVARLSIEIEWERERKHCSMRRPMKQLKLKDLKGVVSLRKNRNDFNSNDLVRYRESLESGAVTTARKLAILKELLCIRVTNDIVQQSEIVAPLVELTFHYDLAVSKAATNVLLLWQGSKKEVYKLAELPIETGESRVNRK